MIPHLADDGRQAYGVVSSSQPLLNARSLLSRIFRLHLELGVLG